MPLPLPQWYRKTLEDVQDCEPEPVTVPPRIAGSLDEISRQLCEVEPTVNTRLCEYCETKPATGYVSAYGAHVCRPCYEDYHGDTL